MNARALVAPLLLSALLLASCGGDPEPEDPELVIPPVMSDEEYAQWLEDEAGDSHDHDDGLSDAELAEVYETTVRSMAEQFVSMRETYSYTDAGPAAWLTSDHLSPMVTPAFLAELQSHYGGGGARDWATISADRMTGAALIAGSSITEGTSITATSASVIVGYRLASARAGSTNLVAGELVMYDRITLAMVDGFWKISAVDRAYKTERPG